MLFSPWWHC